MTSPKPNNSFKTFILGASGLILLLAIILSGLVRYALDEQTDKNLETYSEMTTESKEEPPQNYGLITPGELAQIGLSAPDFLLTDAFTGKKIKLSDYKGIPIILNFWASWCGPCKIELPELQAVQVKYGTDLVVIGVNGDRESLEQIRYFGSKLNLTFGLLRDPKKEVTKAYGVWGLPKTLFIDRAGVIQKQYTGSINQEVVEKELLALGIILSD